MSRSLTFTIGLVASLAACSIPKSDFRATPDGGGGTGDALPSVLSIVVSTQAVEMDEGHMADFTVKLSQAPASPLEIDLASASLKIGLGVQKLFFDANNFGQDQTVMVTGVIDDDTATELAEIKLTGTGVADVAVGATVHDLDQVLIVSDIAATGITVGEATSTDVHVHLSHRPTTDVSLTATMSNGPVTVSPPQHVIHMTDDFSADVTFTLSAPIDQNVADEMQTITFAIASGDQKVAMVKDIDSDKLAISASPTSIAHLKEGDSATLNLTLTKQPATAVTVTIGTTTGKAQIVGSTQVTFQPTGNDYMTNHPVTIMAPQDANTTPETDTITLSVSSPANVATVNVSVQIDDDDVQEIQTTVTNSLTVMERASVSFGATLKFAPTGPFTVNLSTVDSGVATVASSTGANFLTFTAADYNDPSAHLVFVHGTDDNNLVTNSTTVKLISGTLETDVAVDVTDADHEAFVMTPTTPLSIPEGGSRTFTVALAFQPTAPETATLSSTSAALTVMPGSIDFTTANWQMPITVTIGAPVDTNNVSEMGTISVTSTMGPAVPAVSVTASVVDATQINTYGWPTPFQATTSILQGQIYAFPVTVPTSSLDSFGVYVPTAAGNFRMALYQDSNGRPGNIVTGAEFSARPLANGATITDITDVAIPAGTYWIALRVDATTNIGAGGTTQIGSRCLRNTDIPNLGANWPSNFGTCDFNPMGSLFNLWITTYHQ
jgi:hypothetical protein